MSNFQPPFLQQNSFQQMFPQPQGSVYSIGSPLEVGNVPIGSTGLSVAFCLTENPPLLYIKSFQNGSPVVMAYQIVPFEAKPSAPAPEPQSIETRLANIEQILSKITETKTGGKYNELLQSE